MAGRRANKAPPDGGRVPSHSHEVDQLALLAGSAAIIETNAVFVVHPLLKTLWIPAGVEHGVYSPRAFSLHSLHFPANCVRASAEPQALGLDALARELVLFLCAAAASVAAGARHEQALALLTQLLAAAKPESFCCRSRKASEPGSSPSISRSVPTTAVRSKP